MLTQSESSFIHQLNIHGGDLDLDSQQNLHNNLNGGANNSIKSKIDEFTLLIRIIKLERIHFLKEIQFKQLFIITQKDMFTGDSILHYAIFDNKTELTKQIIELNQNEVNMRNEDGNTPLAYACLRGNLEIVKLLHSTGAIMNQKNQANLSPLMMAIHNSHYFVVHYLLGIEQVVEGVLGAFELYRLLQFGISSLSSQIFFLLVEVFQNKIEEIQGKYGQSIWDMKYSNQSSQNADVFNNVNGQDMSKDDAYNSIDNSNSLTYKDMLAANQSGYTLLHFACSCGNYDIFEFILSQVQNLAQLLFEYDNHTKETPLHWAVLKNNYRIVQQLIVEYQSIVGLNFDQDRADQSELHINQSSIQRDSLKSILDLENNNQHTPFFVAITKGYLDVAEILLENGLSSIDVKDMAGDTPLHWGVILGNIKTVEFLISKGINVDEQNYNQNTPLMIACTHSHFGIVETLIRHNANVNKENANGMISFHAACLSGNIDVVEYLLDNKADFMKRDRKNFLPLHYAVIKDQAKLIKYLQTERHFSILNPKYFYDNTQTLMSLAVLNGSYQTIQLFASEWGDNLDIRDTEGNTYLHLAAMSGHVNVFLFFLNKQISISSKNSRGKTAIELAKIYKQDHLIRYLRDNFEETNVLRNFVSNTNLNANAAQNISNHNNNSRQRH
ncbi:serine threonine-protein phosphatase 6 regulatory ankyrin repeat subunit a-like [Stylonychia lemnae]|uniref:Serine threonine-protein phosphatase 6 regulatory ankyrin repeat subunit a-like n=1 Tax=Stylonychia lemnae TaxID=5949 RepID=A0A078A221_STYLE|nr:serine threonine-protein phosphatase 6 regulatory ankyrin repeat subunit a-like [Stylonychia lemnae]|eukprot:CDW75543.1 serine threonine-protein phosphatase 6 regulatory ankyrin repeat subunit a-like [Stylonychia lemnae]